ncbi:TlpA family protein disulfide reductase, partial [Gemmatimonas sp.]
MVALLSLSLFTATGTAQAQAALAPVAVGSSAPDAMLRTLDGTAVSLKQVIGGRPALLQFWATWCSTCTE